MCFVATDGSLNALFIHESAVSFSDVQEKLAEASFKRFVDQKRTLCKLSEEVDVASTTSSQDKSETT